VDDDYHDFVGAKSVPNFLHFTATVTIHVFNLSIHSIDESFFLQFEKQSLTPKRKSPSSSTKVNQQVLGFLPVDIVHNARGTHRSA
jgi:hypothetical protein